MIPVQCDTILRLSTLIDRAAEPIFQTLRFERGKIIVTDRRWMAIERIAPFDSTFHISVSPALIERCKSGDTITVIPNPALGFTMLADDPTNIHVSGDTSAYDTWHERVVVPALTPAAAPGPGIESMVVDANQLSRLAAASPSGTVVFEQIIDTRRAAVVRDIHDEGWCGFFLPRLNDGTYRAPASVPVWLR